MKSKMVELSRIMTEVNREKIGYQPVSLEEFANIYQAEGDGDELVSMYKAAAMGLMDGVTDDFTRITGHTPQNMKDFLAENYKK
jgi:NAD(P)H dehydrogenase (quinone)